MFDFLKQKIQGFTDKLKDVLQTKPQNTEKEVEPPAASIEKEAEKVVAQTPPIIEPTPIISEEAPKKSSEELIVEEPSKPDHALPVKVEEKFLVKKEARQEGLETIPTEKEIISVTAKPLQKTKKEVLPSLPPGPAGKSGLKEVKVEEKHEMKAKPGLFSQVKSFFASEITVEEADIRDFLFELELALLESDVEQTTANAIVENLKHDLVGKRAPKSEGLDAFLKKEIRKALQDVMTVPGVDFWERVESKKPFVIMILGPNGAGKTTSIAKLTYLLQQHHKSAVWASSDTFRSGAIEQLEVHANRLNVRLVKHDYGADPAAVAFDAVKSAQSMNADVVLIDTAGRQETNTNLMKELEKINRVVKPDLKIYVGEAFTGQALLQQAKEFNQTIGIDGFILSKMDTDAKGGTCISVLHQLQKPVLFVGVGQRYEDLIPFKPDFILDRIL